MKTALVMIAFALLLIRQGLSQDGGSIDGVVTNSVTGEPISSVSVTASPQRGNSYETVTDGSGRFSFAGLPAGAYTIRAARVLFFPAERSKPAPIVIGAGEHSRNNRIILSPASVIAGRVVDHDQKVLRDWSVEALECENRNGVTTMGRVTRSAVTDDRGEYRIFNLESGSFCLRISEPRVTRSDTNNIPRYYPGGVEAAHAQDIHLSAGEERAADVTLTEIKAHHVRIAIDAAGMAVGDLAAFFRVRKSPYRTGLRDEVPVTTEELGANRYRIGGLLPGQYHLFVSVYPGKARQRGAEAVAFGQAVFRVLTDDQREIEIDSIPVRPGVRMAGRIEAPSAPALAAIVQTVEVSLRPADGSPWYVLTRDDAGKTMFVPDGSFSLPPVGDGRYRVHVTGLPSGYYFHSYQYGGRASTLPMDIVSGAWGNLTVKIVDTDGIGMITGTVRNPAGASAAAEILLMPLSAIDVDWESCRRAGTDLNGEFSLTGITPGLYRIVAQPVFTEIGCTPETWRGNGRPRWEEVMTIEPGARVRLNLQLDP